MELAAYTLPMAHNVCLRTRVKQPKRCFSVLASIREVPQTPESMHSRSFLTHHAAPLVPFIRGSVTTSTSVQVHHPPTATLAARKAYDNVSSLSASEGERNLQIDEGYRPKKRSQKEDPTRKSSKKPRQTSTGSHHSSKQGRVGGRFTKKMDLIPSTTSTSLEAQDLRSEAAEPPPPEMKELAVVLPRVSFDKYLFLLYLNLTPN